TAPASSASASAGPSAPGVATAASASAAPRPPELAFAASPDDVVDAMLALANVGREDVVFDLGCGDGRILVAAAKRGARAVGFDVDPARVAEAREAARRAGVAELVRVEEADMFTVDLSPATVVTLYLSPEYNKRLLPQLAKLRFGARVVSNDFEIPGVPARQTISVVPRVPAPGVRRRTEAYRVHLWRAPLPDPVPTP
ncbi:MAG: methyltransferase domain-containing protein, partial [Myxococcales bacterium]|nr:methyltransferase domain-containing protein [Myxococcales bacterium]